MILDEKSVRQKGLALDQPLTGKAHLHKCSVTRSVDDDVAFPQELMDP